MPEPKTSRNWSERGYSFARKGECPACRMPVEFWTVPQGNREVPLDQQTFEAHYSHCQRARSYRIEQRLQEGVL